MCLISELADVLSRIFKQDSVGAVQISSVKSFQSFGASYEKQLSK